MRVSDCQSVELSVGSHISETGEAIIIKIYMVNYLSHDSA